MPRRAARLILGAMAVRGILHARLAIPVRPGPLTLAYPKWIPGEHAADGPLTQVVNLQMSAGGQALAWRHPHAASALVSQPSRIRRAHAGGASAPAMTSRKPRP
jgi:hypothetical protein